VVVRYPHFATAYRTHLQGPSSTNISLETIGPETLVRNYHITLRKIPKERKSQELIVISDRPNDSSSLEYLTKVPDASFVTSSLSLERTLIYFGCKVVIKETLMLGRHYTTLHYTTLHYTTPHKTTLYYITPHYTTLHYTTLRYTTPHHTKLHCTTLHHTTLHYTVINSIVGKLINCKSISLHNEHALHPLLLL
jgi:hypothetical protein